MNKDIYITKILGCQEYNEIWHRMHNKSSQEDNESNTNELWMLEHFPVFTQGIAGKEEHIINQHHNIPIVKTDRGGQITYHAPGQLIVYPIINLNKTKITFRQVISALENSTVAMLREYNIESYADPKQPGVYVEGKKIASVGLRVKNGWSTHGLAININMDLTPFDMINPCGIKNLKMVNCAEIKGPQTVVEAIEKFTPIFNKQIIEYQEEQKVLKE